ncbi:MAG: adenosine deaminase family protein [Spirochaetales bacterium]|nr:adenosine deaminase family protein [Spirochaetales bacterium]MCF7937866.1 adenosine deaminase family protein [Spirochaetales bacterium]
MTYSDEFLKAIPKTDLHVHLDGSLRLKTLIELAKEQGVELPANSAEGLRREVFKPQYANLDEYLKGFALTVAVLQQEEALQRSAYELALDNADEGVRYLEVRFAPQLHMNERLSFKEVLRAVDRGLKQAREEINASLPQDQPPFEFGIIVCAMRFFTAGFSNYYQQLFDVHPYADPLEITRMASLELARAAIKIKRDTDIQIVAFDLAGSEYGNPAAEHENSYQYVHKHFLKKTVHAGEAYGPESIFQAITKLHTDRIGHGLHLFDTSMILSEEIQDREGYVNALANYIADNRITVEVCLTSNLQTSPQIGDVRNHSLGKMLEKRLSLTFCTDNRLVSNTNVTKEIRLAVNNFSIPPKQLKDIIIYGFKRSFFYRPYPEKRAYVRRIIDFYEEVAAEYGVTD